MQVASIWNVTRQLADNLNIQAQEDAKGSKIVKK